MVEPADEVGSTEKIIATISAARDGTARAVGSELNLVRRLADRFPRQRIVFLEKHVCYCSTVNRVDPPHLVRVLESLVEGRVPNVISVEPRSPTGQGGAGPARPPRTDVHGIPSDAVRGP